MKKRNIVILLLLLVVAIVFAVKNLDESYLPDSHERGTISDVDVASETEDGNAPDESSGGFISDIKSLFSSDSKTADTSDSVTANNLEGPYKVVRVVDGDTYIININGKEEKVRLIGVDTPESVATDENAYKNCEEGKEASNYMKNLITGKDVYLEYDVTRTDKYGRVLAYVYYNGDQIERILLSRGYARVMTVPPNVNYTSDYEKLQKEAREKKEGFWKTNPWERSQ